MGRTEEASRIIFKNTMLIVGDADAIIALYMKDDDLHALARKVSYILDRHNAQVIFPDTAIAEAITTLSRKHSNPELAAYIVSQYKEQQFIIEYVTEEVMDIASDLFNPLGSKQNTFFDALVAATAKKLGADAIFSFDEWYKKVGFRLAGEL